MRKLMNLFMLSCKEASLMIDKKSMEPLTWKENMMLRMHTVMCKYCTAYEKQAMLINDWLKNYLTASDKIIINEELKMKIISTY